MSKRVVQGNQIPNFMAIISKDKILEMIVHNLLFITRELCAIPPTTKVVGLLAKDFMNLNEAIVETREQLSKLESITYEMIVYFKQATCSHMMDYVSKGNFLSEKTLSVEISSIQDHLSKIRDLRETLVVLESIE